MSTPCLIVFTPLGRFFFGSNHSFKEGFFVVSNRFPQPSGILGCLRQTLLKQKGWLDPSGKPDFTNRKNEIHSLTGTSMMEGLDDKDDNFGIIERLSPIFLLQMDEKQKPMDGLFHIPEDVIQESDHPKYVSYQKEVAGKTCFNDSVSDFIVRSDKNSKQFPPDSYGGKDFWRAYIEHNELKKDMVKSSDSIFVKKSQKGIARHERMTVDEAFYVKEDLSLEKGFSFALIAHFASEKDIPMECDIQLGGEGSIFRMKIEKDIKGLHDHPIINRFMDIDDSGDIRKNDAKKLTLVSPVAGEGLIRGIDHAIISRMETASFRRFHGGIGGTYHLLPAGSVFFPAQGSPFSQTLLWANKIGHNWAVAASKGL